MPCWMDNSNFIKFGLEPGKLLGGNRKRQTEHAEIVTSVIDYGF